MNKRFPLALASTAAFSLAALAFGAVALAQTPPGSPAPVVHVEESIPLAEAFPDNATAREHVFRARQIVLAPGARTEMVSHAGRPSITYVTQGVVREHRVGVPQPIVHEVGAATMDRGSVSHFWENAGPGQATLLVVEVAPRAAQ